MRAKALYDCTADDVGELSFKEGDTLVDVTESKEDGWYEGRVQGTSVRGLFPFNYAEFIPEQQQQQPQPRQQPLTPSKAIPLSSTSDSSRTLFSSSVSPPNSTLSSTWSVISTKESSTSSQDTSIEADAPTLRTDKVLDAFERAMMQQPTLVKNTGTVGKLASEAQKPSVAPKPTQLIKKKPSLGSKKNTSLAMERLPTQPPVIPLTHAALPLAASRVRSLSTSATAAGADNAAPVKLPSLYSKQNNAADKIDNKTIDSSVSRKAMPIIRPKPYTIKSSAPHDNRPMLKKEQPERVIFDNPAANENEEDVEDVDGYQLVRPSQIRQRQGSMTTPKAMPTLARVNYRQQLPSMTSGTSKQSIFNNNNNNNNNAANKNQPTSLPSTLKSSSSSPSDNKFEGISAANNPAPRLPSRPVSKAGRRSRSSKTTAWTSPDPVTTTSAKLSPDTKPKPTQLATIVNSSPSQRSKGRSVSNPPPIQPKPFISKFNNSKPDVPNQSKPDGIQKPPPAPATASKTTPAVPLRQVAARREQWQRLPDNNKTSDNDNDDNESTNVKPSEILMRTRSKSNGWTQPTQKNAPPVLPARNIAPKVEAAVGIAAAKKTPPPPPPSRPVQSGPKVPARYEELFSAIHDEGYVDGPTAKVIWKRSKVTDEALAKIWQQCDPQGSGLLDKNAFIQGMREIDALLGQQPSK